MPYFNISTGLRGCYMPDFAYVLQAKTRRELKAAIEYEANRYRDAGYIGASKRAIATLAAQTWRNAKTRRDYLPHCLPVAPPHAPSNYCEGVFVSNATREEYKAFVAESE